MSSKSKKVGHGSQRGRWAQLGQIRAGERWTDLDGHTYVISWVGPMGVVGFRRADAAGGGSESESVLDVIRFVKRFAPEMTTGRAA